MISLIDKSLEILPVGGMIKLQVMTKKLTTENGTCEVISVKEADKPEMLFFNGKGVLVRPVKNQSGAGRRVILVSKRQWNFPSQEEFQNTLEVFGFKMTSSYAMAVFVYQAALLSLSDKQLANLRD